MSVRIALGGPAREAAERVVASLVEQRIASRITAQDETLFPNGASESLAWTEAVAGSVSLIDQVHAVRRALRHDGIRRVVVPQATGATLAAAMIARTVGGEVDGGLDALDGAAVVVPSDDRTVRAAADALAVAGADPRSLVLLTVDGAAPEGLGDASVVTVDGVRLPGADGALSAASLVPAGLAGADLRGLLDEAESEAVLLAVDDPANNGLLLGAAVAAAEGGIEIVADGTHVVGFPVWAARLLAETAPGTALDAGTDDSSGLAATAGLRVRLVEDAAADDPGDDVLLSGTLGELILAWQYAVAVAAVLTGGVDS